MSDITRQVQILRSGLQLLASHREYQQAVADVLNHLADRSAAHAVTHLYNGNHALATIESGKSLAYRSLIADLNVLVKSGGS